MDSTPLTFRTDEHFWPKAYHPLLGGGSTAAELTEEINKAEANGRLVAVDNHSNDVWKVTVYIPI